MFREEERVIQDFGDKALKERYRKTGVGGRILLKWTSKKLGGRLWTGFI
jgi:hypothetical protein